jgi:hypothetical protein
MAMTHVTTNSVTWEYNVYIIVTFVQRERVYGFRNQTRMQHQKPNTHSAGNEEDE